MWRSTGWPWQRGKENGKKEKRGRHSRKRNEGEHILWLDSPGFPLTSFISHRLKTHFSFRDRSIVRPSSSSFLSVPHILSSWCHCYCQNAFPYFPDTTPFLLLPDLVPELKWHTFFSRLGHRLVKTFLLLLSIPVEEKKKSIWYATTTSQKHERGKEKGGGTTSH